MKSTYLKSLKQEKIYFSKNEISDLVKWEEKYWLKTIRVYKKVIEKNFVDIEEKTLLKNITRNKIMKKLFKQIQENNIVTLEFYKKRKMFQWLFYFDN